jgi:CheY-like chemotaxis protein
MDRKTMTQVFEPYFTTKTREEGTGLGLATVHGIVADCNGFIQLQSTVGEGAVFSVYFPIMEELPETSQAARTDSLPTGDEHILLVDDELALCKVGEVLLSRLGYQVTTTTNSRDAINLLKRGEDRFDLVITDQTMPGLTGAELAREILELRPDMPVILYSGYSTSITEEDARSIGIRRVIAKPLRREMLAKNVRSVLDEG